MPISLLLIDDHELAHAGMRMVCATRSDIRIAACFPLARPALEWLKDNTVDVVVLDLELPDLAGPSVLVKILDAGRCKVIILTGTGFGKVLRTCLDLGAQCVVSKADPVQYALDAIDAAREGRTFVSPTAERLMTGLLGTDIALPPRQLAVLQLLAAGESNKEIAFRLGITPPTVSFHLAELRRRLEATSNRQLVDRARAAGLVISAT